MHKGPEATRDCEQLHVSLCLPPTKSRYGFFFFPISKYILFILYFPFIKAMELALLQRRGELRPLLTSLYAGRSARKIAALAAAAVALSAP